MHPCYKLGEVIQVYGPSDCSKNAKSVTQWKGLTQEPTPRHISTEKNLRTEVDAVVARDLHIRFIIPSPKNWLNWDAAIIQYSKKEGKGVYHYVLVLYLGNNNVPQIPEW